MKPTEREIARRNENCISSRIFNSIIRNIIICTILSSVLYSAVFDEFSLLNALFFYIGVLILFHGALLFGQLPFALFSETDNNHKAPSFYADRTIFGRVLIFVAIFVIFFFLFCIIRYYLVNSPSN